MNPIYLGIDFGTTKTLVSRYDTRKDMPRPVRLGRGIDYVPTSVFMEKDGCFYFGADADDQSVAAPRNYRRAFKLDIGTSTYLLSVRTEKERQRFTAADLTQKFLEYILQQCAEKSYPCDRAVVTRPVDFSPLQEKQLQEAAMSAGLKKIIFITEPEAAGYAYRMESPDTTWQNALVVDWGGGTLDMALVSQSGNELHANKRYRAGISCGGENFDDALRLLATQIIRSGSDASILKEDEMDLSWIYNSRRKFRKEKELLSEQSSRILRLVSHDGIPYQPVKLNRQDFEIGIMPELQRAAKMAKDLIASIEERSLKPEFILLVGGSSQIPAVKRILEQETGLKCRTFDQGNEAVSLGAALYAHKVWGNQEATPAPPPAPSFTPMAPAYTTAPLNSDESRYRNGVKLRARALFGSRGSDESHYRNGVKLLYGIGMERDQQRAVQLFREGYAKGDFNAGYMLTACLAQGDGIARDYDEAFKIASSLAKKNFYPAYYWLSDAFAEGKGTALDLQQAEKYKKEVIHHCSAPLPGVDESIRYNALMGCMAAEKEPDWRAIEKVAQKNREVSDWPMRHGWLATFLLRIAGESASAEHELLETLEAGCAENDVLSFCVKAMIQVAQEQYKEAQQTAKRGLKIAPGFSHLCDLMWTIAPHLNDDISKVKHDFWEACSLGCSAMKRGNDLGVKIEIAAPSLAGGRYVYREDIAQKLLNKNAYESLFSRSEPIIIIKNTNDRTLEGATLRLCSADVGLDKTFILNPIPPHGEISFEANDLDDIQYGERLYVRVSKGDRYSEMDLETTQGLNDFRHAFMPLMLTWGSGLFGGYILKLKCVEGSLSNIVITKQSGATARIPSLLENQVPATVGWFEFSDNASLTPQELFTVQCDGFAPIHAMILESVQNVADTFHPKGNFRGKEKGTTESWYDDPQILEFYRKGAEAGHPESLYQLGCFYLHKGEVDRAKKLLCAAAVCGHSGAKTMLQRF